MSIIQANGHTTGTVGIVPNLIYINTTDTPATVTTTGYLTAAVHEGLLSPQNTDLALVGTVTAGVHSTILLQVRITGTSPNLVYSLVTPVNSGGAIFAGNVQAGSNGVAGALISYAAAANTGHSTWSHTANGGAFNITYTNAAFGQTSTITTPDPGTAAARNVIAPAALVNGNLIKASGVAGNVQDAGFKIIANTTAAYAGGGASNAFAAAGLTAGSIVTAVILTSTNAVAIAKAVPTANVLTVTFTADPGAGTTVSYIATTAAV